jgi:hypothetical protein
VSILRRLNGHLDDAALAELWTNALADGSSPAGHAHLKTCVECRLRFTSFSNWMDDVRSDALGEADEVLTPDRLAAQQAQIFRRLEAAERPARVIAFPKLPMVSLRPSPVRRWIAASAAAGLIAGIGLGQIFDLRDLTRRPSSFPVERIASAAPGGNNSPTVAIPVVALLSEETTLAELEEAATPHYEALQAYDTYTPRAADFINQPR